MDLDSFRRHTRWTRAANQKRYAHPAKPWHVVHVNPADVEYCTVVWLQWGLGQIRGGEWDRVDDCVPLDEATVYSSLVNHFEHSVDWEETALYRRAANQFDDGAQVRGCEDLDEYRTVRCAYVDELFERIRRDGYRPNYETTYESVEDVEYIHDLEPFVLIGRTGEIYWTEGFHRLAIASILDIDTVPVYVLWRHEQWQQKRDEIHETPTADLTTDLRAHLDHPDFSELSL